MAEEKIDGNIVVLVFEDMSGAEIMLENFEQWQEEELITVMDAVYVTRGVSADVEIHQTHKFAGKFARRGSAAGLLAGLLLGGPIGGLVVGAAIGGIAGAMKDYGIDDKFIEQVSAGLGQETSALFLLVKDANAERMLEVLRPHKARVLSTTLEPDQQSRLVEVLEREEGS